jgi:hypothetical protein
MEDLNSPEQEPQEVTGHSLNNILSAFGSRRDVLSAVVGAFVGSAPFLLSRPAAAEPSNVNGSPNVALRVFENTAGTFTLYSSGRIWDHKNNRDATVDLSGYTAAPTSKFRQATPVPGKAKGSPNVAVDLIYDTDGTYVLFADGSVRQPSGGAGGPGFPRLRCESVSNLGNSAGISHQGNYFGFNPAFSSVPTVLLIQLQNVDNGKVLLYYNGNMTVSPQGFASPGLQSNYVGIVIGSM